MRQVSLSNMRPGTGAFEQWVKDNLKEIENASRIDVITDVKASGAALSTLANATANNVPMFSGATAVTLLPISAFSQGLLNDADAATWRTGLGLGAAGGVFGASGGSHSTGLVPDPGAVAGITRFVREDATFAVPPTFVASGASHAPGYVPDPGASAGSVKFLREDASFTVPPVFLAGGSHAVGYVPDPGAGGGTTKFLREDATWQVPPAASLTTVVNSLGADVALNNTANYFDGPSCAQGATGTWFASGTVTINDGASSTFNAKLWDGTTVIASASLTTAGTNGATISLSGAIASPAGNIRISVNDASRTTGKILFNASGNSKDSTLTVVRIDNA